MNRRLSYFDAGMSHRAAAAPSAPLRTGLRRGLEGRPRFVPPRRVGLTRPPTQRLPPGKSRCQRRFPLSLDSTGSPQGLRAQRHEGEATGLTSGLRPPAPARPAHRSTASLPPPEGGRGTGTTARCAFPAAREHLDLRDSPSAAAGLSLYTYHPFAKTRNICYCTSDSPKPTFPHPASQAMLC